MLGALPRAADISSRIDDLQADLQVACAFPGATDDGIVTVDAGSARDDGGGNGKIADGMGGLGRPGFAFKRFRFRDRCRAQPGDSDDYDEHEQNFQTEQADSLGGAVEAISQPCGEKLAESGESCRKTGTQQHVLPGADDQKRDDKQEFDAERTPIAAAEVGGRDEVVQTVVDARCNHEQGPRA